MDKVAFSIFGIDVMWYGILMALGMILGTIIALKEAKRVGISEDSVLDLAIIAIPMGLLGARLYYVLFNWDFYSNNPSQILNFRGGGMAIHGALIAGLLTGYIFTKVKKINFLKMADAVMIGMPLAQSIGRWGNFINQEAHGGPTNLPWGIMVNGEKVHPTFLYESIWDALIFIFLWIFRKKKKYDGQIIVYYIGLYSIGRFFIEGLRTDSLMIGSLKMAQVISLIGVIGAIIVHIYLSKQDKERTKMEFHHVSVLLDECIENLNIKPDGVYVDCTMGGAGHSKEIVKRLSDKGLFIGFDQDKNAIATAKERLSEYSDRVRFIHSNFENIKEELAKIGVYKIDGVLADLGVSSHQLDEADRGFSYMQDAPLDMRMDVRCDFSAYDVVNTYSEEELFKIIKDYGEDNWAKRIAKFIVEERQEKTIETTGELVEIIKKAIPKKARIDGPHPAKRTFQAIRIEVNNELGVITKMIDDAVSIMNEGGRVCIITFHSLEDRIVKNEFRDLALDCVCPSHLPICQCDKESLVKVITRKPILPSKEEIELNPRSRSAKLRVAERV